jgi:hypothetical protein
MPKPCSLELRERVVNAVESGASRREAADWFDVSPRSARQVVDRNSLPISSTIASVRLDVAPAAFGNLTSIRPQTSGITS